MRRPTDASRSFTIDAPVPTLAIMSSSLGQNFYRFVTSYFLSIIDAPTI
jgi:hypothetical protein